MSRFAQVGNAYATLQVDFTASQEEIRSAYRRLMRTHHPDRFVVDTPEWQEAHKTSIKLNEAYDVLQEAETRARYDRWLLGNNADDEYSPASSDAYAASQTEPIYERNHVSAYWEEANEKPRPVVLWGLALLGAVACLLLLGAVGLLAKLAPGERVMLLAGAFSLLLWIAGAIVFRRT